MLAFLKTASPWGGLLTIILLVIVLLRQLIAFIGFLMFAIKVGIVLLFVGLMLLIVISFLRSRSRRHSETGDL
jgi:hypothetical protein